VCVYTHTHKHTHTRTHTHRYILTKKKKQELGVPQERLQGPRIKGKEVWDPSKDQWVWQVSHIRANIIP
jgi:hypothetical protein